MNTVQVCISKAFDLPFYVAQARQNPLDLLKVPWPRRPEHRAGCQTRWGWRGNQPVL